MNTEHIFNVRNILAEAGVTADEIPEDELERGRMHGSWLKYLDPDVEQNLIGQYTPPLYVLGVLRQPHEGELVRAEFFVKNPSGSEIVFDVLDAEWTEDNQIVSEIKIDRYRLKRDDYWTYVATGTFYELSR